MGRRAGGHRGAGARHPQDHARAARAGEVRGALRRRRQPPDVAVRRGAGQGQPRGRRRRRRRRPSRPSGRRSRTCRSRSRSTPSTSCARSLDAGADLILLDNFTPDDMRGGGGGSSAGRAAAGGQRRADPGHRPRRRRDRRRLPRGRRADPLRARSSTSASTCASASRVRGGPMLLAIDVGNTHTVLGSVRRRDIVELWRISTDAARAPPTSCVLLQGRGHAPAARRRRRRHHGIAICSTVPSGAARAARGARRYYGRRAGVIVEPGRQDRRAGPHRQPQGGRRRPDHQHAGRHHLYGGPAIVVDFGTSTNFDVVSARTASSSAAPSRPGIEISVEALGVRGAPSCARSSWSRPRGVIGKNTVEAMQSGASTASPARSTGSCGASRASSRDPVDGGRRHRRPGPVVVPESRDHHRPRARPHPRRAAAGLRAQHLSPVGPASRTGSVSVSVLQVGVGRRQVVHRGQDVVAVRPAAGRRSTNRPGRAARSTDRSCTCVHRSVCGWAKRGPKSGASSASSVVNRSSPPMSSNRSRTQGTRSSRQFHSTAT